MQKVKETIHRLLNRATIVNHQNRSTNQTPNRRSEHAELACGDIITRPHYTLQTTIRHTVAKTGSLHARCVLTDCSLFVLCLVEITLQEMQK